jgi:hypothetical protein
VTEYSTGSKELVQRGHPAFGAGGGLGGGRHGRVLLYDTVLRPIFVRSDKRRTRKIWNSYS